MAYSTKLVMRQDKADSDGRCPIFVRVTVDRKTSYLFTGVNVKPKNWSESKQSIKNGHASHVQDNGLLEWYLGSAKAAVLELLESGTLSSKAVVERMRAGDSDDLDGGIDFLAYCRELVAEARQRGQVAVFVNYNKTANRLEEYSKGAPVPMHTLDHSFARKFETWMVKKYANTGSTINKYFDTLRAVINRAIREKRFEGTNPLLGYRTKEDPVMKDRLSKEELRKLSEYEAVPGSVMYHAQKMYMFSFWCAGMRFRDVVQLKWDNVVEGRLIYMASKTKKPMSIKLVPQALEILDLYGPPGEGYIFPIIKTEYKDLVLQYQHIGSKNSLINKFLKSLAEKAGVNKHISFHTARHSFSDLARKSEADLYSISKILGHSSLKMTEQYLASLDLDSQDQVIDSISL
jgi:integrase/recombinase XerD